MSITLEEFNSDLLTIEPVVYWKLVSVSTSDLYFLFPVGIMSFSLYAYIVNDIRKEIKDL